MNNYQCSQSERETTRTDFSIVFLENAMSQGGQHGRDPYNNIGVGCGVSWPQVYQVWDDIWFRDEADHKHFRNILRYGAKKAEEIRNNA